MYQDKLFAMNESFFQASESRLFQGSTDQKIQMDILIFLSGTFRSGVVLGSLVYNKSVIILNS